MCIKQSISYVLFNICKFYDICTYNIMMKFLLFIQKVITFESFKNLHVQEDNTGFSGRVTYADNV